MKSLKALAIALAIVLEAALFPESSLPADYNNYKKLDTTYQQQSSTKQQSFVQGCNCNCCCKKNKGNKEVPIGKNPNLNNPDTVTNNIKPEEVK